MLVNYAKALKTFELLSPTLTAPALHPYYVMVDAKRSSSLKPSFFVFEDNGEIFYHAYHLSPIAGTPFFDIQSPYGYGGPLASTENNDFLIKAWSRYYEWNIENKILAEFIRFHPNLKNWQYFDGTVKYNRATVWIDLRSKNPLATYSPRVRTAIRKALKLGVKVEWWKSQDFVRVFPPLYKTVMSELNADEFYQFSDDYFQHLLNWDQARTAVCILEDQVIAAGVFLQSNNLLEYHLSAANLTGKRVSATNLLLHEAVLHGQQLDCSILHLGGGTNNTEDNSLLFFKSGFSKQKAEFRIGMKIYFQKEYEQMKNEYITINKTLPSKFLFYR